MGKRKSFFAVFLAVIVLLAMLLPACAVPVQAASSVLPKELKLVWIPGESSDTEVVNSWEFPENVSLKHAKCKTSNKKVATIERSPDYGGQVSVDYISIKGPGKATLTAVAKKAGGKYKTYKIKVTVEEYTNPLKTFKIGAKSYKKKFNDKISVGTMSKKTLSGKLNIKPAKGFKITKITASYPIKKNGERVYVNKKLKDGMKIDVTWTGDIFITVKNTKTKEKLELRLYAGYAY